MPDPKVEDVVLEDTYMEFEFRQEADFYDEAPALEAMEGAL